MDHVLGLIIVAGYRNYYHKQSNSTDKGFVMSTLDLIYGQCKTILLDLFDKYGYDKITYNTTKFSYLLDSIVKCNLKEFKNYDLSRDEIIELEFEKNKYIHFL